MDTEQEPPRRRGGGRKSAALENGAAESHILYAKARAEKEQYLAKMAEIKYNVESDRFVARDEVQKAAATAMATIAQTLRAIPDNLERRLGISPGLAEEIGIMIDEAMNDLANELEAMSESTG